MRSFILSTAALGALVLALPAHAQDSFEGFYVGGSVGYSVQPNDDQGETIEFDRDLNGSFTDTLVTSGGADAFSPGFCGGAATGPTRGAGCVNDKDGLEYYARLGYDMQFGKFVLGAVAEAGRSEVTDSATAFSTTPASYTFYRDLDWNASLRLRGGIVAGDSTLFYGTLGPSYAKVDHRFITTNTANGFVDNGKDSLWGFTGGGGIEQKLGSNFSIGVEYLFSRYDDSDYRVRATQGTAPATNPFVLSGAGGTDMRRNWDYWRIHSMRLTAGFRF